MADAQRLWEGMFDGSLVSTAMVEHMTQPREETSNGGLAYGLGFWLRPATGVVVLEGMDAGVSFRSTYNPTTELHYTVMSNTSNGVWPLAKYLDGHLAG